MKSLKQYLKESETYGIWDSEAVDRTEMGESCDKIKESASFSKSKIIPLDKVKDFMNKARDKYDVDSHMEGNELIHAFYKKGTSNHVGTFVNSNRTYFYNDADKIIESTIKEATMSDIPHEIDDQIHKLKDMRFGLEETQKNWELAGLDTTPLSNVITGINELIHSMYNNGAKLADQDVVNESFRKEPEFDTSTNDAFMRSGEERKKWENELEEKMKRMGNEMGHWGLRASYDVANKISSNRNKIYDEYEKIYNDFDKFMSKYGIKKM